MKKLASNVGLNLKSHSPGGAAIPEHMKLKKPSASGIIKVDDEDEKSVDLFDQAKKDLENTKLKKKPPLTFRQKLMKHCKYSSMFCFHKDLKIRKLCIQLAEPPDIILEYQKADREGTLDRYHQDKEKEALALSKAGGMFAAKPPLKRKTGEKTHPSKHFENCVMFLIFLSSVLLMVDNPLSDPDSVEMKIIAQLDICLTVLFFIEAMIKIIAERYFSVR